MRSIWLAALAASWTAGCAGAHAGGGASPAPASPPRGVADPWFAELPNDTRIGDVAPGRFAMTYDYHGMVSCSQSWGSTSSRATVVLQLAADGTATGCRGRSYFNVEGANDEYVGRPDSKPSRPPLETKYREQQGMRGRWRRDGRAIVVDLQPDAGVCPKRAGGAAPVAWHLRCALVEPTAATATATATAHVRQPVLACAWLNQTLERAASLITWPDPAGYVTAEVIPGYWMLLAPGAGVRLTERSYGMGGSPSDVSWTPAAAPIPFDDWAAPAR